MSTVMDGAPGYAGLKEFLIFRVDAAGDDSPYYRELADESALESEASNYAGLMAVWECEPGIHYEVRSAGTGELLYTTGTTRSTADTEPRGHPVTEVTEVTEKTGKRSKSGIPGTTRKEAPCRKQKNRLEQPGQLRMAIL